MFTIKAAIAASVFLPWLKLAGWPAEGEENQRYNMGRSPLTLSRDAECPPVGDFRNDALEGRKLHMGDARLGCADGGTAVAKCLGSRNHLPPKLHDGDVADPE